MILIWREKNLIIVGEFKKYQIYTKKYEFDTFFKIIKSVKTILFHITKNVKTIPKSMNSTLFGMDLTHKYIINSINKINK